MTRTKEPTVKNRAVIVVLVALLALMAASGASAKRMHRANANVHAAQHSLVKQASKAAMKKIERRSYRSLL